MSATGPKLELRQGQSLVMTVQLQQSIKLLQLSSQELAQFIAEELEKNPLLTLQESEEEGEAPASSESEEKITAADDIASQYSEAQESPDTVDLSQPQNSHDSEAALDIASDDDWRSGDAEYTQLSERGGNLGAGAHTILDETMEQQFSEEKSLRDHLLDQLSVDIEDPAKRIIGTHLIDMLDLSGYISEDITPLAELLQCDKSLIEETLDQLQRFDPPGVCARNLSECLAIQLREKDRLDPIMQTFLEHLDLLAQGKHEELKKICGIDADELTQIIHEIKALNPRPAAAFGGEVMQSVEPDVYVRRLTSGGWHIELSSHALPRVLVNQRYYARLSERSRGKEERKYLTDQLSQANWLVRALDQRAQTMLKVSTEIVRQQEEFFLHGIHHLKPLTQKEVADAVELHESTISRVTSSKYIATPRGIYELKYFFTSGLNREDGAGHVSSETVKYLIKKLIDEEDPASTLSDDGLAGLLSKQGIEVARRTVTKYREAMRIPSSVERRRTHQLRRPA